MEYHPRVSSTLRLVVFGITALSACGLLVFIVWMQTFIYYDWEPWIVEPIILFIVTVLSVAGAYLLVAPNSESSPVIAALIPIIVLAVVIFTCITHLSLLTIAVVAITAAAAVGWAVRFLQHHNLESRIIQVLAGMLVILASIMLVVIANKLFVVDLVG